MLSQCVVGGMQELCAVTVCCVRYAGAVCCHSVLCEVCRSCVSQ